MARKLRRDVIDEANVGAYHAISRTARRAFLIGVDPQTGQDYNHRKDSIVLRLQLLATIFAVELLDHSILDTHFHLILRNRPDLVQQWSDRECAARWLRLNRATIELRDPPTEEQIDALVADEQQMAKIRRQLSSISWYMGALRESLARLFNQEEGISGIGFWAPRFGCIKLDNETSLLACSFYLAMNPTRAGIADSVETSHYTSVQARLMDRRSNDPNLPQSGHLAAVHVDGDGLAGAAEGRRPSDLGYLELTFDQYLDVLDQLIRREQAIRQGQVEQTLPSILERLGIQANAWNQTVRLTSQRFTRELEQMTRMKRDAQPGYKVPIHVL